MTKDAEAHATADYKPVGNSPLVSGPPLVLIAPRIDGPLYEKLEAGHPLYEMAAWAHHHAARQPLEARRGLFLALARAWPKRQPRRRGRDSDQRAIHAAFLAEHGRAVDEIAATLHQSADWTRRLIARGRELYSSPHLFTHPEEWTVETVTGEPGLEPEDPAGGIAHARMMSEDLMHALSDDERRAREAITARA